MRPLMRVANGAMLLLFASWAAFQYNDPDVLIWLAVYGAAAVECLLFFLQRFPKPLGMAYMVLCVLWAIYLAARVALEAEFIFDEQGREMIGLVICAGWTLVLYKSSASRGTFSTG